MHTPARAAYGRDGDGGDARRVSMRLSYRKLKVNEFREAVKPLSPIGPAGPLASLAVANDASPLCMEVPSWRRCRSHLLRRLFSPRLLRPGVPLCRLTASASPRALRHFGRQASAR